MTQFAMIRQVGKLVLKADGFEFGSLVDCEACWLFEASDEQLSSMVNGLIEADMSQREMLNAVKEAYVDFIKLSDEETAHEKICEGAWLKAAEYDPEAVAEMEMQDNM